MTAFLGWILLGLVAGVLAKAAMPGSDPRGVLVTIFLGMVGSIIGGLIGKALFSVEQPIGGALDRPSLLFSLMLAVVGSVSLLALYGTFTSHRRNTARRRQLREAAMNK